MRRTQFRRSKSGISSVLGMIFGVAIVVTAIIPLFLYVNNINNFYNKTAEDMRDFDQQRSLEKIVAYVYVINNGSAINVQIKNRCVQNVKIERIWVLVNETHYMHSDLPELESEIEPSTTRTVFNIALPPGKKTLVVKIVTSKGNIFGVENNPVYIVGESWGWEPYSINICMQADEGWVRRTIYVEYIGPEGYGPWNNTVEVTQLVVGGYAYQSVGVPVQGCYRVMIWEWVGKQKKPQPYFDIELAVAIEMPSPWVFVPKK